MRAHCEDCYVRGDDACDCACHKTAEKPKTEKPLCPRCHTDHEHYRYMPEWEPEPPPMHFDEEEAVQEDE